jgi:hypothetical protein
MKYTPEDAPQAQDARWREASSSPATVACPCAFAALSASNDSGILRSRHLPAQQPRKKNQRRHNPENRSLREPSFANSPRRFVSGHLHMLSLSPEDNNTCHIKLE